jgi:predicted Fe-Mo cluster-binding NifX family protein
MKIAVTYENGQVFQHFGHTEQFKVYTVEDNKVVSSEIISTNRSGHSALSILLSGYKVNTLICGGIGGGAKTALAQAGINLYGGVTGDADSAVSDFLAGKLIYNPNTECNHHADHHGECAEHDHRCGNH